MAGYNPGLQTSLPLAHNFSRREFLVASGATVFGSLSARPGLAEVDAVSLRRAAVVIGVDRTDGLTTLSAAASGARKMGAFLEQEGFEVAEFVDDGFGGPVVGVDNFRKINAFVELGNLDQLVIYFAGHGFMHGYSEYWLLSGAPKNSSETIGVLESAQLAHFSGIPNVVFISDACRSTPTTLGLSQIQGGYRIFPSGSVYSGVKVDMFFATVPGHVAYEITVDASISGYKGIFTEAFLDAFHSPWPEMVLELQNGLRIVPNRKLEEFLIVETRRRAVEFSITLEQRPEARVTSKEDRFIGRALNLASLQPPDNPHPNGFPAEDMSTQTALRELVEIATVFTPEDVMMQFQASNFDQTETQRNAIDKVTEIVDTYANSKILNKTGLTLNGAGIARIVAPEGVSIERQQAPIILTQHVLIDLGGRPAATVYVDLDVGLGFPLAVFDGFVVNVKFDPNISSIVDVRYSSIRDSTESIIEVAIFDQEVILRSAIATAVAEGAFLFGSTVDGTISSAATIDRVRLMTQSDPALGIYAAYAFFNASLPDEAKILADIVTSTFDFRVFDIELFGGGLHSQVIDTNVAVYPFCPAFRPSWEVLRANNVTLPEPLQAARGYLSDSLWTAFTPEGGQIIKQSIEQGALP